MLSIGPELAALPGMHLVDPSVDCFDGQTVYLDFDGAGDVTYNGPVVIEGLDIPGFCLPDALAGGEQAVIESLVDRIEGTFCDSGITFTTLQPAGGEYSTVYIGGDGAAFEACGSFLGLADGIDVGNNNHGDSAFVFSDRILVGAGVETLVEVTVHEIGHLLGYAHDDHEGGNAGDLTDVAYTAGTHKFLGEQMSHLYKALFGVEGVTLEHESYLFDTNANASSSSGYSIMEGLVEEDATDAGIRSTNHFSAGGDGNELYGGLDTGGIRNTPYENARDIGMPTTISEYNVNNTASAYWWLGRTMHLLQDSCVPAHVHKDYHMGDPITGDDEYEKNAYGLNVYFTFDTEANGTSWDYQQWVDGKWSPPAGYVSLSSSPRQLWDRSEYYTSLESLFRETTDYTDDYDSDDYAGDCNNGVSGDGFPTARLAEIGRDAHRGWADNHVTGGSYWLGKRELPWSECRLIARDVGTWAVEQSAIFLRYFYDRVGEVLPSPTNPRVDGEGTDNVNLSWDGVHGADGYVVYRSTNFDSGFHRVGSPSLPGYADTGLDPDTNYYYRIYAYNDVAGLGDGYTQATTAYMKPVSILTDEVNGDFSPNDISLREALGIAEITEGRDTIRFAPELVGGTITLDPALGELKITDDLDLMGLGAENLTIQATGNHRVVLVEADVDASISGLTITGGYAQSQHGGGVANLGTLDVIDATITNNEADGHGGGIYNEGTLLVSDSTVAQNDADANSNGGDGGGIYSLGKLDVLDSNILDNFSPGHGGGIVVAATGNATVLESTVSGNSANGNGGGIQTEGTLSVHRSTVAGNTADANNNSNGWGGGIINFGTLHVADSTISGNVSRYHAGGIHISPESTETTVANSTISGNVADGHGGGIYDARMVSVFNSTIVDNTADINNNGDSGGGIYTTGGSRTTLHNTIVAGNRKATSANDLVGDVDASSSYNLIGHSSTAGGLQNANLGNIVGHVPQLQPLADNGGMTWTHALLPGSPAIDAGDPLFSPNNFIPPMETDQRGTARGKDGSGNGLAIVDIGAFEYERVSTWQGGNDTWTAANWHDGTTPGHQPPKRAEMIIDSAGSIVRVEQEFVSGGNGPAASVAVGETESTVLEVNAMLEVDGAVSIGPGGVLSGAGTIQVGDRIRIEGDLAPGDGIGILTAEGNTIIEGDAMLSVELSGGGALVAGTNNDLLAAENLMLVGSPVLQLEWLPGQAGDGRFGGIYTIATYSGTLSGAFAEFTLTVAYDDETDASIYIDTTYGNGGIDYGSGADDAITVKLKGLIVGDANLDGDVDVWQFDGSGDAQLLSSNLGETVGMTWSDGDFNFDGDVDVWQFDGGGDAQLLSETLGATLDAARGRAVTQNQDTPEPLSATIDWQYEYESVQSKRAKSKQVAAAVDLLLATDWA